MIQTSQQLKFGPLQIEELSERENLLVSESIDQELQGWLGTKYWAGQQCKGVGVDCIRFVSGILDFLLGEHFPVERLPQDMSMHNRLGAMKALKGFLNRAPHEEVTGQVHQPGDIIIMGPVEGGPGHGAIASDKGFWHSTQGGVCYAGKSIMNHNVFYYKTTYRLLNRESWLQNILGGQQ